VIEEEVAEFQATDAGQPFWGLRVIWSTGRNQDPRSIIEEADNCIATKLIWPQLVAGYDLGGSECLGKPLADRLPELFWFRKQCALEDVQVPFFLRAASESLGATGAATTTTTADGNLFDALLLGARRIGCALSLHKHPRLVEAVKDRRILVEINSPSSSSDGAFGPTRPGSSNNTVQLDSLSALLAQGVPCVLCDDGIQSRREDPAGVGSRMTSTFWRALHASWGGCSTTIDLATLGSLAENSVRWAAFEDQDAESWYVSCSCRVAFPIHPSNPIPVFCCCLLAGSALGGLGGISLVLFGSIRGVYHCTSRVGGGIRLPK
jgi:adenosine deaminase CECR1